MSNIIQNELKDPRLSTIISITHLNVTKDLRYAKVFVSIMGTGGENSSLEGLRSAAGLSGGIGHRIQLRYTGDSI